MEWQVVLNRLTKTLNRLTGNRTKWNKRTSTIPDLHLQTQMHTNSSILTLTVLNLECYGNWIVLLFVPFVWTPILYRATKHCANADDVRITITSFKNKNTKFKDIKSTFESGTRGVLIHSTRCQEREITSVLSGQICFEVKTGQGVWSEKFITSKTGIRYAEL